MKNVPNKIYLQIDADGETPKDFKGLEVTWCKDKIYDNDIEFLRKDFVSKQINKMVEHIRKIKEDKTLPVRSGVISLYAIIKLQQLDKELNAPY